MESSIQQIMASMLEGVLETLKRDGLQSIDSCIEKLQSVINPAILQIVTAAIEQMDQALVDASKERRKDKIGIKQRNVHREVLTGLGTLRYRRTYFENKSNEENNDETQRRYFYLVDQLIGVEPYERVSRELCAKLVQYATEGSMAMAVKRSGASVSRQTVDNKVLTHSEVTVEATHSADTPETLHLFADEDHVPLKSGKTAIVPLVTVTEGIDTSQKRHKTINAVHFEGYGMSGDAFFEGISSYLNEKYDMENIRFIFIHADGGQWINRAADWFPGAIRVMDGFHLQQRFRQLSNLNGASAYMQSIRRAVREDKPELFASCCVKLLNKQDDQGKKRLSEVRTFIQNNWNEAVTREKQEVCGSCTEPLVSHVLSARLSRNPLAWSEDGLRQMAMLRVYTQNGGVVSAQDIRVSRKKDQQPQAARYDGFSRYRAYADAQINDFLSQNLDWSLFEPSSHGSGKLDAVYLLRKAFGSLRNSLAVS